MQLTEQARPQWTGRRLNMYLSFERKPQPGDNVGREAQKDGAGVNQHILNPLRPDFRKANFSPVLPLPVEGVAHDDLNFNLTHLPWPPSEPDRLCGSHALIIRPRRGISPAPASHVVASPLPVRRIGRMDDSLLEGVRVLEVGGGFAAAFATRWLAGFGADVVRADPPDESLTADEQIYLLPGKRRVAAEPAQLRTLALAADIVIEDQKPGTLAGWGMSPLDLRAEKPALVVVSVTPFGQSGPYATYEADNIVAFAMGGLMSLTGHPSREPLVTGGSQAYCLGALNAFGAAVTALYGAMVQGEGDWIDISLQEAAAGMLELYGPGSAYNGLGAHLRAGNHVRAAWAIYPCADGFAGVCALERQIPALFAAIGDPELQDERFRDPLERALNDDELQAKLYAWFSVHTKDEILAMSPKFKVPFGAVLTPADLLENPSLAERGYFDEVMLPDGQVAIVPGRPFLGFPWTPPSALHVAGADTASVEADWLGWKV